MLRITLDLSTGTAKLAASTTIVSGAAVPVRIECVRAGLPASPGADPGFLLGFGPDTAAQSVKAYLDAFAAENETVWTGTLNANDVRLNAFMTGRQSATLKAELRWTDAEAGPQAARFTLTCEPGMINGPEESEGGPVYVTAPMLEARLAPVAVPASSDEPGVPGAWAADATHLYLYTGDGLIHRWLKIAGANEF